MKVELEMAKAKINLSLLAKNIKVVRSYVPPHIKILFAVKRDGYGHGIVEVSKVAEEEGIDYLGVADIEEAQKLRQVGIKLPILILGLSRREHIKELVKLKVSIAVANIDFAEKLNTEAKAQGVKALVQVIVDTGLGRFGIFPQDVVPFFKELHKLSHLEIEGIFSHLAVADSVDPSDKAYTLAQIEKFNHALQRLDQEGMLPPLRHIGNSPCLVQYTAEVSEGYFNMVRIGSILYGYPEVNTSQAKEVTPIATVTTNIIDLRDLPSGSYISYGRTYKTNSPQKIAVLPLGYGSGLHRGLSNRGEVIIRGQRAPIVGKICLDHTMVDVTGINVEVGDEVEVLGPRLRADEIGDKIGVGLGEVLVPLCRGVKRFYSR